MLKHLSCLFLLTTLSSCAVFQYGNPEFAKDSPEQTVALKGVDNFRNIAGLRNADGKQLKSGLLYRSANLNGLKPKTFSVFKNLGIKQIIDLRTKDEIAKKPDRLPQGVSYINLAAFDDRGDQLNQARRQVTHGLVTKKDAENRMLDFYKEYPIEKPEVIHDIIHQVLDADAPILYHCTAGKDRTGIITALILKVLRFDDATIYNDYLSSNNLRKDLVYRRLKTARKAHFIYPKMDIGVLEKLSWIETAYLKAAFDSIDEKYGSVDNYIHQVLGIDEAQRETYIAKFTE